MNNFMDRPMKTPMTIQIPTPIQFCIRGSAPCGVDVSDL
jgi:hypothetical protein